MTGRYTADTLPDSPPPTHTPPPLVALCDMSDARLATGHDDAGCTDADAAEDLVAGGMVAQGPAPEDCSACRLPHWGPSGSSGVCPGLSVSVSVCSTRHAYTAGMLFVCPMGQAIAAQPHTAAQTPDTM